MIGQTLGHYRIVERIGAGGMGEVYRAHDEHLGRDVAIKVLPAHALADESAHKRFRKEAEALSKLNHPNIATVFDFDTQGEVDFLAMEFVSGTSLAEMLRTGRLPEKEVCLLGMQIAAALQEAHEHGIIHRDLKPQNIMVTLKRQAKVLDFGLATLLRPQGPAELTATLVETKAIRGTLPYMAPEQLRGEPADARTDIWAAGAVLYEMATGERPFREQHDTRLADDILHKSPAPPMRINPDLSPRLEDIVLKCLDKEPDNRYQSAKELEVDLRRLAVPSTTAIEVAPPARKPRVWRHVALAAGIVMLGLTVLLTFYSRKAKALTERDTILLADFANTTGEAAFDGILKQAMAVQLGQSPFLNIFPEQQVRETLRYMGRSPDDRVTDEVAREICERQGLKAMLTGSFTSLGSHYVITVQALNCLTGDSLAREQAEAESREQVLAVLDQAAARLRRKLGESLSSIQKFDVPLAQATTSSLEAFKAYTLGREQAIRTDFAGSIPLYKRAIELDPNFASAYANLSVVYQNLGEQKLEAEYAKKAFELRDRVSEREKFFISSRYFNSVTGELDKSIEIMEVWRRTYTRDYSAVNNLGFAYERMGELEKAAEEYRAAIALNPRQSMSYQNFGRVLLYLNRVEEAKAVLEEEVAKKLDFINTHLWLFELAFGRADAAAMQREAEWAVGKPGEFRMIGEQVAVALFEGRLVSALELTRQANQLAARNNIKSELALGTTFLAEHGAFLGECQPAREAATAVKNAPPDRDARVRLSVALAFCGQTGQAEALVEDLAKRFPTDLVLNAAELPAARAAIELNRGNPDKAIELLRIAGPFERIRPQISYIRGLAFLRAGKGREAAGEFEKIAGPRGIRPTWPGHSLAYLGLARAYALMEDTAKSRKAYEDVLALWRDADLDVPAIKQAKAEYAKLK
jgi:tetratricopeptide (TPR) repeat protein/tRNA A-37 threonylcarbamoyl transferase component Bud32